MLCNIKEYEVDNEQDKERRCYCVAKQEKMEKKEKRKVQECLREEENKKRRRKIKHKTMKKKNGKVDQPLVMILEQVVIM
jgi:hypothetical protein